MVTKEYTVYGYYAGDQHIIKGEFSSLEEAENWIAEASKEDGSIRFGSSFFRDFCIIPNYKTAKSKPEITQKTPDLTFGYKYAIMSRESRLEEFQKITNIPYFDDYNSAYQHLTYVMTTNAKVDWKYFTIQKMLVEIKP